MSSFRRMFWVPLLIAGCGTGGVTKFPTAKVSGVVLCNGQPVGHVRVVFGPIAKPKSTEAGRAGLAMADEEGNFVVSTYGNGDGAVVGDNNVIVSGPLPEDFPDFNCACETDPRKVVQKVTVEAGTENEFSIELRPKTAKSAPNISAKELREMKDDEMAEKQEEELREKTGN